MRKAIIALCAIFALPITMPLIAADLTLVGNSATDWDTSSEIWTNVTGSSVAFSAGDNILISSESFTGPSLTMKKRFNPGSVVFDITGTLSLIAGNTVGLGPDTVSFTKRGPGTLLFNNAATSVNNGDGGLAYGNTMTNGIDIVEGEIACVKRNWHNTLGPRTIPFPVRIRDGASLTFLDGNQTGNMSTECGIKIILENGGRLNICTNKTSTSGSVNNFLCVNTLDLSGGDIATGAGAYYEDDKNLGGKCTMKICCALAFSGRTPHAFGFNNGTYAGCKHYATSLLHGLISLNSQTPVEFHVDDITDDVDAYVNMKMFTWGTNTVGVYRSDIVKTGSGTLNFPVNTVNKTFLGDFVVRGGVAEFEQQGFFPSDGDEEQTIAVYTNGTFRAKIRNVIKGSLTDKPSVDVFVDHGRFEFAPSDRIGCFRARNFTFDDAEIVLKSQGHNPTGGKYVGSLCSMGTMSFKGRTPYVLEPDASLDSTDHQAINVYNDPRTTFDVADITGNGHTDVTIGCPIWNYSTNGTSNAGFLADSGFVKTGAGTLSVACPADTTSGYAYRLVSGVVTVSNGVMRVDGSLVTPSAVEVAVGAYLGGTGTVANVTMEAGAGLAALAGDVRALTVQGDLALPATGVVEISNPGLLDEQSIGKVSLVSTTGILSGTENLKNWIVKINGEPAGRWQAYADGSVVKAKLHNGMIIVFR